MRTTYEETLKELDSRISELEQDFIDREKFDDLQMLLEFVLSLTILMGLLLVAISKTFW